MKKLLQILLKKIDDWLLNLSDIITAVEIILAAYLLLELAISLAGWLA